MRRIDTCINCGDERELVSHGWCARCYMGQRREAEKRDEPAWASPDRSQRRYIAERNKMLVNLTKIVKLVDETPCISPDDIQAIKTVIRPYLLERAESLAPTPRVNTLTENSELTVNPDEPAKAPDAPAEKKTRSQKQGERAIKKTDKRRKEKEPECTNGKAKQGKTEALAAVEGKKTHVRHASRAKFTGCHRDVNPSVRIVKDEPTCSNCLNHLSATRRGGVWKAFEESTPGMSKKDRDELWMKYSTQGGELPIYLSGWKKMPEGFKFPHEANAAEEAP